MSVCSVCSSKYLAAIEAAIASGEPKSTVARRHGVSRHAIKRHVEHSLEGVIVPASRPELEGRLHDLDGRLVGLEAVLQRTLEDAMAAGKASTLVAVARELRMTLESIAKLRGQLDERPVVNLAVVPEFRAMTSRLLDALLPYPEARLAAAGALSHTPTSTATRPVEQPPSEPDEQRQEDEAEDRLGASALTEGLDGVREQVANPGEERATEDNEQQQNGNDGQLVLLREGSEPSTERSEEPHDVEDGVG